MTFEEGDIVKVVNGQYEGLFGEIVSVPDDDYHPYGVVAEGSNTTYWFKGYEMELVEPVSNGIQEEDYPLTFETFQENQMKREHNYPSFKMNNGTHKTIDYILPLINLNARLGSVSKLMGNALQHKDGIIYDHDKGLIQKELSEVVRCVSQLCSELGISYEEIHEGGNNG